MRPATLVRCVLVPATMKMLGRYNWYLPKWLEWIPNVSLGEQPIRDRINRAPGGKKTPLGLIPGEFPMPVEEED